MPGDAETHRTVVCGFDALDARYLDRFADSLPNFERLRVAGVEAPLASTLPPWTASAWPSLYTGTDPSHHGVFDFFRHDAYPDEGELVSRADVEAPALWNYATAAGRTAVVLNVPVTHPAEPIDGAIVPGYLAAEDAPGYPEGIREELSAAIGREYRIYARGELSDDPEEKLAGYLDLIDLRRRAALALLDEHDPHLAVFQVQKTDAVFHNFDDEDAHRAVYEAADAFLGSVVEAVDEDTNVVVCSDHGMGPVRGYRVHVNEVLREHGYVEAAEDGDHLSLPALKPGLVEGDGAADAGRGGDDGGDGTPAESGAADETETAAATGTETAAVTGTETADATRPVAQGATPAEPTDVAEDGTVGRNVSLGARALAAAANGLARVGVSPDQVSAAAARLGVEDALAAITPASVGSADAETVDWRASRAYLRRSVRLGVRINLEGREPEGVVPAEEFESVRSDLVELLSALETPDGELAFDAVGPREAYFDGPYADRAPDVVAIPRGMDNTLTTSLSGRVFSPVETYDHKREGVFLAAGPGVAAGVAADAVPELVLTDVAPTVVALLGLPVPERMTGAAPERLLAVPVERTDYGDVPFGIRDDVRSDDAVVARLEDLGYL